MYPHVEGMFERDRHYSVCDVLICRTGVPIHTYVQLSMHMHDRDKLNVHYN